MKTMIPFLLLILTTACGQGRTGLVFEDKAVTPVFEETIDFETLKARILEPKQCLVCHKSMSTEAGLASVVQAGFPDESELFLRTQDGTMPMGLSALTNQELEIIRSYILGLVEAEEARISFDTINSQILTPKNCLACHKRMSSEANLMNWIDRTNPDNSKFYKRVQDGSMPKGGPALDASEIQLILRYVRQFKS